MMVFWWHIIETLVFSIKNLIIAQFVSCNDRYLFYTQKLLSSYLLYSFGNLGLNLKFHFISGLSIVCDLSTRKNFVSLAKSNFKHSRRNTNISTILLDSLYGFQTMPYLPTYWTYYLVDIKLLNKSDIFVMITNVQKEGAKYDYLITFVRILI
jgi:hypothetical protein